MFNCSYPSGQPDDEPGAMRLQSVISSNAGIMAGSGTGKSGKHSRTIERAGWTAAWGKLYIRYSWSQVTVEKIIM
jgi:hypothetical protein